MEQIIWILLGTVALLSSLIVVKGAFVGGIDHRFGMVVTTVGMITWGLFGLNAWGVEIRTDCCVTASEYPALGYLGILGSLLLLGVLLWLGALEAEEAGT